MLSHLSEKRIGYILEELCTKHGFCLPPEDHERLLVAPPQDVDDFADAVFVAEGLDPADSQHRRLREAVRATIIRHL